MLSILEDAAPLSLLLEPMKIAETISYGGYGTFASAGRYDIRVDVARPGSGPVSFEVADRFRAEARAAIGALEC